MALLITHRKYLQSRTPGDIRLVANTDGQSLNVEVDQGLDLRVILCYGRDIHALIGPTDTILVFLVGGAIRVIRTAKSVCLTGCQVQIATLENSAVTIPKDGGFGAITLIVTVPSDVRFYKNKKQQATRKGSENTRVSTQYCCKNLLDRLQKDIPPSERNTRRFFRPAVASSVKYSTATSRAASKFVNPLLVLKTSCPLVGAHNWSLMYCISAGLKLSLEFERGAQIPWFVASVP